MTRVDRELEHDTETTDAVQERFQITYLNADVSDATVTMSMPMAGLRNPFTGAPAVGPLAILVDAAGGMVNHYRRRPDQWTVSSELSVELSPRTFDANSGPVQADGRPLGPVGASSLGLCTLSCGETVLGGGTVRSFFIPATGDLVARPTETLHRTVQTSLADVMAVEHRTGSDAEVVLAQRADPNLFNELGIVHGGVAAAGLELVASAAINRANLGDLFQTASLKVNFLRPFIAGRDSRYVGSSLRIGRRTAVGDAQAIGDDGKLAITARVTAYR
jgi:uncharacterized protein (TIGR00369 family)